jgi:peptidyl-prolyl cis-trans isomerase NIMA-interacting 1
MVAAETESEIAFSSVADLAARALEDQQQQQLQQQQEDNYLVDQHEEAEELQQQQQQQQQLALQQQPVISLEPPPPLPPGWILKESRSQPGVHYYYNQETFETTWHAPYDATADAEEEEEDAAAAEEQSSSADQQAEAAAAASLATAQQVAEAVAAAVSGSTALAASATTLHKRSSSDQEANNNNSSSTSNKKSKTSSSDDNKQGGGPREVRVLHILKKHKDSRRPSSWRYTDSSNPTITLTRDEAREELEGLLDILQDEVSNPENLIATFKELASQESDCSSAKRHGDLGFFGRKKMRPEFEAASFALKVNELSPIIETASGFHVILRLE